MLSCVLATREGSKSALTATVVDGVAKAEEQMQSRKLKISLSERRYPANSSARGISPSWAQKLR